MALSLLDSGVSTGIPWTLTPAPTSDADPTPAPSPVETVTVTATPSPAPTVTETVTAAPSGPSTVILDGDQFGGITAGIGFVLLLLAAIFVTGMRRP